MKKRPITILYLTLICASIAPLLVLRHYWLHGNLNLMTLTPLTAIPFVLAVAAIPIAFGVYRVTPTGYFAFLMYSVATIVYLVFDYLTAPVLSNYVTLMTSILLAGATAALLQKHVTAPYFNPRMKWWERDPRYRVNLQAEFQIDGDTRSGSLLDLSQSGCYAAVDTRLAPGDTIYVNIRLLDHTLKTMAKVIWENRENNGGYGIMFTDLATKEKRELKSIINYLSLSMGETGPVIDQGVPETAPTTTQATA